MDETNTPESAPSGMPAVSSVKIARSFPLPGAVFCVASGELPGQLYFGSSDFSIYRVDSDAEKPKPAAVSDGKHDSYVTGLVRNGDTLISGSYDGSLIWWDAATGDIRHCVKSAHEKWIRKVAISPDGTTVASVGDDMKTRVWNAKNANSIATWDGYEPITPHGYPSMLYAAAFSPDGKWLATGNRTGKVLVRDAATGRVEATLETPVMYTWDPKARRHSIGGIRSLAFSSDSRLLAVGGMGQVGNIDHLGGASRIEIFEWQSGERTFEIEDTKFKGLVEQLQFGPDDEWLVAAGGDNGGFVSVYSATAGTLLAQEKAPMHVFDFQLSDDGSKLRAVGFEQASIVDIA
ncbi:MAG TPA: hypothetical protein EYG03_24765 [Planctomycetes bacterium]|nr:hypothetical protein [Fuerstiella sp.]HIK95167.1 hypothetical protein [Planctomycetota bacterium]